MLYPKSKEPQLSEALFRNPTKEYRGTPFWAWNCELDQEELLWQLEILKKMGMGGAHMHVRTGMTTPYLSEEHMRLIKACVEKCKQEDMLAWLYDEDRWPSGAAGGIVTKEEKYRKRYLLLTAKPYADDRKKCISNGIASYEGRAENGYLLGCYDAILDEGGYLTGYTQISEEAPAQGTKLYAYVEVSKENPWFNNQTYVNTMDPAAIQRFIEVTHERYREVVGEEFGNTIPAIFTDEALSTCKKTLAFAKELKDVTLPWTDDLPQTFFDAYGEDIVSAIPELLWELPDGKVSTVRYHFFDHACERFVQAYADQLGSWCAQHNLMSTGHLVAESSLHGQACCIGEAMRFYRNFQLPGIDMLADKLEYLTAKQAQSASHQYGREGVMSELYGVTGWDFDFRGHKFQGDWQAALGVTVRVPHLSWVSMKGEAKRDYPASINYQSSWWQDYAYVEDHFARVATAMTRGKPEVRVGVIHPVESIWLHYGPTDQTMDELNQMNLRFEELIKWLLFGCIDFDLISESLLPEQCAVASAPLQVGEMTYDVVLVPGCETLRSTTLERLEAFAAAGGTVIFLGEPPKYENAVPSLRGNHLWESCVHTEYAENSVLSVLSSVRDVDIKDNLGYHTKNLFYQLRRDGEDRWLFVAHGARTSHKDAPVCQSIRLALKGQWDVTRYDTLTGTIQPIAAEIVSGSTIIKTDLYDLDSLLLRYSPVKEKTFSAIPAPKESVSLAIPKRVFYTLSEPNVYLMDKAEFALNDEPYRLEQELLRADNALRDQVGYPKRWNSVAQPWAVEEPAPEHTVRLRFRVHCQEEIPDVSLALEDADSAAILCNGAEITAKPNGWFVDKSISTIPIGTLRKGEDTIEVVLPFGRRVGLEWCYLLGNFGVQVMGEYRALTQAQPMLGFDSVVHQGLAHYGGNITYHVPFESSGGAIVVTVPHYAGAAVKVSLDGQSGYIVCPPYRLELDAVPEGSHTMDITLLGTRYNSFGPVHLADPLYNWFGPNSWRTEGVKWTESYRLKPLGILSAPQLEEIK